MSDTISIPGYTIEGRLGQGGMASVYLAIQKSFGRQVALKVMSPVLSSDPTFATRFMREARIVAALSHASIVPVFEVGEHGSLYYLSMEYLPAGDLKSRILNGERSLPLAIEVCTAVCSALDVAHRKGFVHRDIKPENILFREDGTPVLTDFGIARALDSGRALTMAGMMVGTPNYMSPEQVRGEEVDGRSDLYAVGVVFYEILTGDVPFHADSSLSVALRHITEPLPPLPKEFAEYQGFVDQLTAKERDARFATGTDVLRALRQLGPQLMTDPGALRRTATPAETTARPPATKPEAAKPAARGKAKPKPEPRPPAPKKEKEKEKEKGSRTPRAKTPVAQVEAPPRVEVPAPTLAAPEPAATLPAPLPTAPPRRYAPAPLRRPPTPPIRRAPRRHTGLGWLVAGAITALATVGTAMMLMRERAPLTAGPPTASHKAPANPAPHPARRTPAPATAPVVADVPAPATDTPRDVHEEAVVPPVADATPARPARPPNEDKRAEDERRRKEIQQRAAQLGAQARAAQIKELLAEAHKCLATGALWQPPGASVADRYREILRLQSRHPEALSGARKLADVLVEETQRNEAAGDIFTSTMLISQIRSLRPGHPKLKELKTRLEQLQTSPPQLDARAKGHLERARAFVSKAREQLGKNPLDGKAVDDATEQYDNAMTEMSTAPGLPSLQMTLVAAYPAAIQTELSRKDTRRAQKLIATARKRGWTSTELDRLEASMPRVASPGETGPST